MKKTTMTISLCVLVFSFFGFQGCVSPPPVEKPIVQARDFSDFDPATLENPVEVAIGRKLVSLQKSSVEKDREAMLAHYAPNAIIQTSGGKASVKVAKSEYIKILAKSSGPGYRIVSYGYPTINMVGLDSAVATTTDEIIIESGKKISVFNRYVFKEVEGDWLIIERTYTYKAL